MKSSRCTSAQVAFGLRQAEDGTLEEDVCSKIGISGQQVVCILHRARPRKLAVSSATFQRM